MTVEVADSGPGPPPELAESLCEAFVTSKPEGVGLGLALARQVAAEQRRPALLEPLGRRNPVFVWHFPDDTHWQRRGLHEPHLDRRRRGEHLLGVSRVARRPGARRRGCRLGRGGSANRLPEQSRRGRARRPPARHGRLDGDAGVPRADRAGPDHRDHGLRQPGDRRAGDGGGAFDYLVKPFDLDQATGGRQAGPRNGTRSAAPARPGRATSPKR